jgi:hypothetical protein
MSGGFAQAGIGPGSTPFQRGQPNTNLECNYLPQALRLGVICNDPHPDWNFCKGCFEVLLEYDYSVIVGDFGSYFTGPNAILRYNFVHPDCIVIPYIQGGAGFVFTDAYRDTTQHLIGEEFEFLLRAEVGLRTMITENLSLDIEGGFQHISNAGLAQRNAGLNTLGGMIGLTFFFGK